jgi:hypothetical protein
MLGIVRNSKGMTLIEISIATFLALIGIVGSCSLLSNVHGTLVGGSETVQIQQDARVILENIARELRESDCQLIEPSPLIDSYYIGFHTPRDSTGTFRVDEAGNPELQRYIQYGLDPESNCLYRYQSYLYESETQYEIVVKNVQSVVFNRIGDVITISIRTFADQSDKTAHAADSYTDFATRVRLRN